MSVFDEDLSAEPVTEGTPPEGGVSTPVADPAAQLAEANAKADDNYNKFLMAMADFENYKKRMQRDIESIVTTRRRNLLERFLPVIDNLERALSFDVAGDEAHASLRAGVEATLKGFGAVLAGEDVRPIDVANKPFDPKVAEAIGTVAAPEGVEDDTIVQVVQKGYTIGEELLRAAQVIVAKTPG